MYLGKPKLLIFIITFKASFRVKDVFKNIPFKKLKKYKTHVLISDDCSMDDTIDFANKAATLSVQNFGNYTPTLEEFT